MEEMKSKKKPFDLNTIEGHITEFAVDQKGSHEIQNKIKEGTDEERIKIFDEILPRLVFVCNDQFGNYAIQKLLTQGNEEMRKKIVSKFIDGNNLMKICTNS